MSHHCEYGVESPLNYPVSDVKVWGRNITHGLYDQGNIGLIPHFDVETLCKYITIKNYTMEREIAKGLLSIGAVFLRP